jgi:hypothetical protein
MKSTIKKIKEVKKGSKFIFNDEVLIVKQVFSDWKKDNNPYLLTTCGEYFFYDELEIEFIN